MSLFKNIMKMGNMKDIGDVAQKIQALAGAPQQGAGTSDAATAKIAELEKQNAELALYVRTLFEVCKSKGVFTDDEFNAKFKELDLLDGVEDGR